MPFCIPRPIAWKLGDIIFDFVCVLYFNIWNVQTLYEALSKTCITVTRMARRLGMSSNSRRSDTKSSSTRRKELVFSMKLSKCELKNVSSPKRLRPKLAYRWKNVSYLSFQKQSTHYVLSSFAKGRLEHMPVDAAVRSCPDIRKECVVLESEMLQEIWFFTRRILNFWTTHSFHQMYQLWANPRTLGKQKPLHIFSASCTFELCASSIAKEKCHIKWY